jgi:hypothetical protein
VLTTNSTGDPNTRLMPDQILPAAELSALQVADQPRSIRPRMPLTMLTTPVTAPEMTPRIPFQAPVVIARMAFQAPVMIVRQMLM